MDRERKNARCPAEEAPYRLTPLKSAQGGTFPNCILGDQFRDSVGIVMVVVYRGVARFEITDRLGVPQRL
jgi:hypothetical protein